MMGQAGNGDAGKTRHAVTIAAPQYSAMCILSPNMQRRTFAPRTAPPLAAARQAADLLEA
jgi:hypothetical protein